MNARPFDPTDPANYDHWVDDRVRFCDQDAAGHVNNTAIAQYVESGRVGYAHDRLWNRGEGSRFIAARVAIDFLAESHYPGQIRTGTRVSKIGKSSVTTLSGVFKDGVCIAVGECVLVHLNDGGSAPLTDAMRTALQADEMT